MMTVWIRGMVISTFMTLACRCTRLKPWVGCLQSRFWEPLAYSESKGNLTNCRKQLITANITNSQQKLRLITSREGNMQLTWWSQMRTGSCVANYCVTGTISIHTFWQLLGWDQMLRDFPMCHDVNSKTQSLITANYSSIWSTLF